ncbi:hypothetical protein H0H87_006167, partial [Tephrocybe sp. NHM501043]
MGTKPLLVTGATGKQGTALITALLDSEGSTEPNPFRILALTRNATTPAAKHLKSVGDRVTVVEGDLEDASSLRKVFEDAKNGGEGIWGVFSVQAYPGLGANADGIEKQGKILADLALEFSVSYFVYSSADRGGEGYDENWTLDRQAKVRIERHIRDLGTKGLNWTILRPGIFMENFEGTVGSITAGVFKAGLKPDTTIQFIAVEDIGRVASAVFKTPEPYVSKILVVVGDILTMSQVQDAYRTATGKAMPSTPNFLARIIIKLNGHTQALLSDLERIHRLRIDPGSEDSKKQMDAAHEAYPAMATFAAWATKQQGRSSLSASKGWNRVSIGRLLL